MKLENRSRATCDARVSSLADEMLHLCNAATDQALPDAMREDTLLQIELRCHVQWSGDLYLYGISGKNGGNNLSGRGFKSEWILRSESIHRV
jgi:hypothetical protein